MAQYVEGCLWPAYEAYKRRARRDLDPSTRVLRLSSGDTDALMCACYGPVKRWAFGAASVHQRMIGSVAEARDPGISWLDVAVPEPSGVLITIGNPMARSQWSGDLDRPAPPKAAKWIRRRDRDKSRLQKQEAVIILGGTFGPLTNAHLERLLEAKRTAIDLGYTVSPGSCYFAVAKVGHVERKYDERQCPWPIPPAWVRINSVNALAEFHPDVGRTPPDTFGSARALGNYFKRNGMISAGSVIIDAGKPFPVPHTTASAGHAEEPQLMQSNFLAWIGSPGDLCSSNIVKWWIKHGQWAWFSFVEHGDMHRESAIVYARWLESDIPAVTHMPPIAIMAHQPVCRSPQMSLLQTQIKSVEGQESLRTGQRRCSSCMEINEGDHPTCQEGECRAALYTHADVARMLGLRLDSVGEHARWTGRTVQAMANPIGLCVDPALCGGSEERVSTVAHYCRVHLSLEKVFELPDSGRDTWKDAHPLDQCFHLHMAYSQLRSDYDKVVRAQRSMVDDDRTKRRAHSNAEWTDRGHHPRRPWKVARDDLEIAVAYCRHQGIPMKELIRSVAEHTLKLDDAHWLLRAWYGDDVQCLTHDEAATCLQSGDGVELTLRVPGVSSPVTAALTSSHIKQSINDQGWAAIQEYEKAGRKDSAAGGQEDQAMANEPPPSHTAPPSLASNATGNGSEANQQGPDASATGQQPSERVSQPFSSQHSPPTAREGVAPGGGSSAPQRAPPPPPPQERHNDTASGDGQPRKCWHNSCNEPVLYRRDHPRAELCAKCDVTWRDYSRCEHCDPGCSRHLAPSCYIERNDAQLSTELVRLRSISSMHLDAEMRDAEAAQDAAHVYFSQRRRNATDARVIARLRPEQTRVMNNIGSYLEKVMLALMEQNRTSSPHAQGGGSQEDRSPPPGGAGSPNGAPSSQQGTPLCGQPQGGSPSGAYGTPDPGSQNRQSSTDSSELHERSGKDQDPYQKPRSAADRRDFESMQKETANVERLLSALQADLDTHESVIRKLCFSPAAGMSSPPVGPDGTPVPPSPSAMRNMKRRPSVAQTLTRCPAYKAAARDGIPLAVARHQLADLYGQVAIETGFRHYEIGRPDRDYRDPMKTGAFESMRELQDLTDETAVSDQLIVNIRAGLDGEPDWLTFMDAILLGRAIMVIGESLTGTMINLFKSIMMIPVDILDGYNEYVSELSIRRKEWSESSTFVAFDLSVWVGREVKIRAALLGMLSSAYRTSLEARFHARAPQPYMRVLSTPVAVALILNAGRGEFDNQGSAKALGIELATPCPKSLTLEKWWLRIQEVERRFETCMRQTREMRNKPGSGRGSKWQRAGTECSRVLHTRLLGVACARLVGPWVKMPSRMHWRLKTQ